MEPKRPPQTSRSAGQDIKRTFNAPHELLVDIVVQDPGCLIVLPAKWDNMKLATFSF